MAEIVFEGWVLVTGNGMPVMDATGEIRLYDTRAQARRKAQPGEKVLHARLRHIGDDQPDPVVGGIGEDKWYVFADVDIIIPLLEGREP